LKLEQGSSNEDGREEKRRKNKLPFGKTAGKEPERVQIRGIFNTRISLSHRWC
jgi:hypothetical protein